MQIVLLPAVLGEGLGPLWPKVQIPAVSKEFACSFLNAGLVPFYVQDAEIGSTQRFHQADVQSSESNHPLINMALAGSPLTLFESKQQELQACYFQTQAVLSPANGLRSGRLFLSGAPRMPCWRGINTFIAQHQYTNTAVTNPRYPPKRLMALFLCASWSSPSSMRHGLVKCTHERNT